MTREPPRRTARSPGATTATLTAPGYSKTVGLDPAENGAYLLVIALTSARPPDLAITTQTGKTCRPFATPKPTADGRLTLPEAASNCTELTGLIR